MIDPMTASIVVVLGKYALDRGTELARFAGPTAKELAGKLFETVMERLRHDPKTAATADEFVEDPETYKKPLEKKLKEAAQADPALAEQLKTLLAQYETAAQAYAAAKGTSYQANLQGSGAIAQGEGAKSVGARGVMVGGNVAGHIITGDGNKTGSGYVPSTGPYTPPVLSPTLETLREKISYHFNVGELKNLCQDMNIAYENLAGEGLEGQVRELIAYCERHGRLDTLIAECKRRRPNVDWT